MALFISRNGEKYGPYSMAEAQAHFHSGNLVKTDWAWQEGLPDWIPLSQIPGFASAPSAPSPPVPAIPVVIEAQQPSSAPKSIFQKIGGGLVAGGIVLLKFKALLLGSLKTGLSMLFMIWLYSMTFGWQFGVGFVLLILVHEMGHVVAAKWLGIPVSAPLFIPFVGAFIAMKENPRDAWTEALMAYGGPLAGCIGSWICLLVGQQMGAVWLVAIASASFVINLFNMIPIPPLDGGRICAAISPWFWLIGIVLLGAAIFYFHSVRTLIVLAVIVFFSTLPRLKETFFGQPTEEMRLYYSTHISNRLLMAVLYLGLFAALLLGYWNASQQLSYLWQE